MTPRARKVQQNGHKCHAAIPSQKTAKTRSISFLIHGCSTSCVALSIIIITSHYLSTRTQKLQ